MIEHLQSLIFLVGLFLGVGYGMYRQMLRRRRADVDNMVQWDEQDPEAIGAFSIAGSLARKATKAGVPIFYTADAVPNFANYTDLIRNEYESVKDLDDITRTLSLYYYFGGKEAPSPTQVY